MSTSQTKKECELCRKPCAWSLKADAFIAAGLWAAGRGLGVYQQRLPRGSAARGASQVAGAVGGASHQHLLQAGGQREAAAVAAHVPVCRSASRPPIALVACHLQLPVASTVRARGAAAAPPAPRPPAERSADSRPKLGRPAVCGTPCLRIITSVSADNPRASCKHQLHWPCTPPALPHHMPCPCQVRIGRLAPHVRAPRPPSHPHTPTTKLAHLCCLRAQPRHCAFGPRPRLQPLRPQPVAVVHQGKHGEEDGGHCAARSRERWQQRPQHTPVNFQAGTAGVPAR
jgi:hypothetical protein